ncbi:alpha-tectorin-like [Amphiura filiformis]|uniref:alpha-tectorin-like n=1 Tax=Amphiura filiformis TaxID=82378 RepID=UPI003B2116BF
MVSQSLTWKQLENGLQVLFTVSYYTWVPKRDINVFGSSWGVGEECGGKPVVAAECKKDSPQDKLARERCAYLDRENTGPFGEAIRVMSEKEEESDTLENFRKACWYDVCTGVTGGDNPEDTKETKSLRCKAMGDAAQYINGDSAGFFIDDWEEQCDCPDEKACEEEHTTWSEMVNPCPEVCGGLSPKQQKRCGKRLGHTEPGCECDEGFVLQGAKCVKEEECGCRKQGITRAAGDEFFTKKCKEKCLCIAGGSLECTKVKKGSEDAKACKKGRGSKPGKKGSSSSKSSKKGSGSRKRGSRQRGSKKSKGSVKRGSKKNKGSGKRGSKKGSGSVKRGSKKGSGSGKRGSKKGSGSVKRGSKKGSGSGKRGSKKSKGSVKRGSKKGSGSRKRGSKKGSGSGKRGSKKSKGSVKRGSKKGSGSGKHGSKKAVAL